MYDISLSCLVFGRLTYVPYEEFLSFDIVSLSISKLELQFIVVLYTIYSQSDCALYLVYVLYS